MITLTNFSATTGFPQLQIALVSNQGFIEAFPIDGLVNETFPKLRLRQYNYIDALDYNNAICNEGMSV